MIQEVLESRDAEFTDNAFEQLVTRCEPENENPHAVVESSLTTRLQIMGDYFDHYFENDHYMDSCLKSKARWMLPWTCSVCCINSNNTDIR